MKPKRHLSELLAKSDDVPRHTRVTSPGHSGGLNHNKDYGEGPSDNKNAESKVADHKNEDDDDVNESYGQYGSDDSSSDSHHYYFTSKHSGKDGDTPAN